MTVLSEANPIFLAVVFFKSFVYLELLAVLAMVRVVAGSGASRIAAACAAALALVGIGTTLAPLLGAGDGPIYASARRTMAAGGGWPALALPSVLMVLSAFLPEPRWRAIDLLHAALFALLVGLWIGFG